MASNDNFNLRLSQLQAFEKSEDYLNIVNTLNDSFDSDTNDIIQKWILNETLSNVEKKYIDLYSSVQLAFVKYCFFYSNTIDNVQTIIDNKFRARLFQTKQINALAAAVEFIREQKPNSNNNANENDLVLVYIMRMIDARSLSYRLYFKNLSPPPRKLNNELKECLLHRHAKNYLYDVKSINTTNQNMSIDYRHQFFIGCCTFAVALYEDNKEYLKSDEPNKKYICLLAKYVRVMLSTTNFAKNEPILYCIRGILALLTNCIPTEDWLSIMNDALQNENDENAQRRNPFTLDLFSLIINKLLESKTLQKKTKESDSNNETLLLDTVLVFLVKWSDTQRDLNDDDDDEENKNDNNHLSIWDKPNSLLNCFRSHNEFQDTAQIIIPYTDAKYDRLRLMALSILSNIMNYQDFEKLKDQKPHMAKDLVELIFNFINQAEKQPDHKYKGISFDKLLLYLHRFLVQDFVKQETLHYISQIVGYAKNHNLYALKILRRISTSPKTKEALLKTDLKKFLEKDADADIIYGANRKMYKIVKDIRENLAPPPPPKPTKPLPSNNDNKCQAFISYCHADSGIRQTIQEKLKQANLFTKIWIDKENMKDNMYAEVAKAIGESKAVFILLSDAYCKSDFCRREWIFSLNEKVKIYVIIVQEDFNKQNYDWVRFSIGDELYYKMDKKDDFPKLIENLSEFLNKNCEDEPNRKNDINKTRPPSLPLPSTPKVSTGDRKYSETPIARWTSQDVQNWCIDKQLNNWCKSLTNFDGQDLLVLRQSLSNDSNIQYFVDGRNLNGFEVVRFKSEVDKILLKQMSTTLNPPTKTNVIKRRPSKSSNKSKK